MTNGRLTSTHRSFEGKALCTNYDTIWFGVLHVDVGTTPVLSAVTIFWGIALHRTGVAEVVGQWLAHNDPQFHWSSVASDLAMRGTTRIGCLVGSVADDIDDDFLASISSHGPAQRVAMPGIATKLSARLARQRIRTEKTAGSFEAALHRAVRRRPACESGAAALEFVERTLKQVGRRIHSKARRTLSPELLVGRPTTPVSATRAGPSASSQR